MSITLKMERCLNMYRASRFEPPSTFVCVCVCRCHSIYNWTVKKRKWWFDTDIHPEISILIWISKFRDKKWQGYLSNFVCRFDHTHEIDLDPNKLSASGLLKFNQPMHNIQWIKMVLGEKSVTANFGNIISLFVVNASLRHRLAAATLCEKKYLNK